MTCLYNSVVVYLSVFIAICEALGSNDYEVLTPTLEALYPRGLRVALKGIFNEDGTPAGSQAQIPSNLTRLPRDTGLVFSPLSNDPRYEDTQIPPSPSKTLPQETSSLIFHSLPNDHRYEQALTRPSPSTRLPQGTGFYFSSLSNDHRYVEALTTPNPSTRLPQDTGFHFSSLSNDHRYVEALTTPNPSTRLPQDTGFHFSSLSNDTGFYFSPLSNDTRYEEDLTRLPQYTGFYFSPLSNDTRYKEALTTTTSPSTRPPPDTSSFSPSLPNETTYEDITVPSDCAVSKTIVQGIANICKDQLLFSEEFAKTSLRALDKWDALIQFPGEPDYPFNAYIPDKTVSFEEDSLVITPVLTQSQNGILDLADRCTGLTGTLECRRELVGAQAIPPVTTAKITTRRSFNFMFGRVEVRAKLPSGSWMLPEINLESTDNVYGPDNYESGLMRVAFVRGNLGLAKKLYGGPVLSKSEPFRSALLQEKIGIDNWHKNFHNYTMIWRPDGIDLLVDGEQYGTVNPNGGFFEAAKKNNVAHASRWQKGTVMAPLDKMFHITLGLRVGGVNDFSDDLEDKPWKNGASKAMLNFWRRMEPWHPSWYDTALKVDYVRVYAI